MSKKGRKKTSNQINENPSQIHRKIGGAQRRAILEQTGIPSAYHKKAVVKKSDQGEIHVYYGGIGTGQYHFHGHIIIAADGQIRYHRLPFSKYGEAERYSDGIVQRGKKFKRHFCY